MGWTKQIDRTKFDRNGWVMCSFNRPTRKWICAMFPNAEATDDDPVAAGEGDDPLEAMLAMCLKLGAIAETGEWVS